MNFPSSKEMRPDIENKPNNPYILTLKRVNMNIFPNNLSPINLNGLIYISILTWFITYAIYVSIGGTRGTLSKWLV